MEAVPGELSIGTDASDDVLYTCPMRRWEWASIVIAAMYGLIGFVLLFLWLIFGWGEWLATSAVLALGFGFILVTALLSWWLAWRLATQDNAWVLLNDEGIFVCNWRRQKAALSWADVRAMYWRLGAGGAPGPTLHVKGPNRTLRIPVLALGGKAGALLAKQIAERARLHCVRLSALDLGGRFEA